MANTHTYTKREEIANAITHGIGIPLSIAALVFLLIYAHRAGTTLHISSAIVFGSTMILLYLCSTLLHSLPEGKAKDIFEIFDHSSIYLFIAGTYTPFLFLVIRGTLGWTLFGVIWGIAALGIVFKAFFTKKFLFLSTLMYIVMGWLIIAAWTPLVHTLSPAGIELLVWGGILYTVGTIFYVWRGFPFHHAVWHVFVLGGTALHFFAVLFFVLPLSASAGI
jgi:hemolysin III